MTLNVKRKCNSKRQTEYRWWLWKPKLRMWFRTSNWEVVALSAETEKRWWLWTPTLRMRWGWLWTPILRSDDDDSKPRNRKMVMMALNAKLKMWWWWLWTPKPKMRWWWLWMPKLKMRLWTLNWKCDDDGSERWNWRDGSERQNYETMMAMNVKRKTGWWLWMPTLKSDGGSKRRN